jgi:hypothetical protein
MYALPPPHALCVLPSTVEVPSLPQVGTAGLPLVLADQPQDGLQQSQ